MAPPSKSNHPVAVVRKCTGKTQEQFAVMAGLAPITIRKIESGKGLSLENAAVIAAATGADPDSLLDEKSGHPREFGRNTKYSAESFEIWQKSYQNDHSDDPRRIIQYGEALKEEIEGLLFASVTMKHRKFRPVLLSLCQAIGAIGKKFRLDSAIDSVRKGHAGPKSASYETEKMNAFLYRMLGKLEFPGEADLPEGPGLTELRMDQVPAFEAKTLRWQRATILKEIRRLARLTAPTHVSKRP